MPKSLPEAIDAVRAAVDTGKITKDRIDQSVLRIVKLRMKYGLPTR
jgi:beta-N-acetylhexosaminidase